MAKRTAYVPTTWVDSNKELGTKGTPLNAEKFNKIEQAIVAIDTAQTALEERVESLTPVGDGSGLTQEQLELLNSVQEALNTLQESVDNLTEQFNNHVHDNEAGDVTGSVVTTTE